MSGGAVFQRALAHLVRSGNNRPAVIKALEAGERGPRQFAYELGLDAGLKGGCPESRGVVAIRVR